MQVPDLAAQMLETAIKKQGLKGAAIGGSVLGDDFANEKYHPVLKKAEELGAVLFIHPQTHAAARRRASRAMAGSRTRSAIRSTPRSRCRS